MKISRLITYGAIGIIGGLLFENRYLIAKMDVKDEVRKLKKKLKKDTSKQKS